MNKKSEIDIVGAIKENPASIFTDPSMSVAVLVDNLRNDQANFIADLSTDKGRRAIASRARSVVTIKTSIDSAGKDMNAELREKINAVDEIRREVRTSLDSLRDEIRKPLDDWEAQEQARVDSHKSVIDQIVSASYIDLPVTSADISARIDWLSGLDLSSAALQEYSDLAKEKAEFTLSTLMSALERIRAQEAERAELERLRAQQAEKEAAEAKEHQERDHYESIKDYIKTVGLGMIGGQSYPYIILIRELEEKIIPDIQEAGKFRDELEALRVEVLNNIRTAMEEEQKRFAADEENRRKREAAEQAAAAAEQARREAEAKAEQEKNALIAEQERKERERMAAEQREREEADARARDKEHRRAVNHAALSAIMEAGQIGEDRAKKIVTAICAGEIPHVLITY